MKKAAGKALSLTMDTAMYGMMNVLQWHRRDQVCSREEFSAYLAGCAPMSREDFFHMPALPEIRHNGDWLEWKTPRPSGFPENDLVRVRYQPCRQGPAAPTLLLLHALMSGSDVGYRRLANFFNDRGWNVAFPHLPFHYSRTPRGHFNGVLAVNANLILVAETLRQCVVELRQLTAYLRTRGSREFAVLGTSYGGWNGALLSFLEPDLRFLALVQPIVNLEHAIWGNPGSAAMRSYLRARNIEPGMTDNHLHLCSPLHGIPLCGADRAVITAGLYDQVALSKDLVKLKRHWKGSKLIHVRQGHFGYVALRKTLDEIDHLI